MVEKVRIATRKSPLALAQANQVAHLLQTHHPQVSIDFLHIQTSGDLFLEKSLASMGGKGLFVKEIEEALLQGQADIAVHSLKDVPFQLPADLSLAAFPAREDARDTLVLHPKWKALCGLPGATVLKRLPQDARIGTTSLRRKTQVWRVRADLKCEDLRGNIQTRLKKLEQFDAIILAAAGLNRMQMTDLHRVDFSIEDMLPAPGQGMLAVEIRKNNGAVRALLQPLTNVTSESVVQCERAFLTTLRASCHVPVAGHALVEKDQLIMRGMVLRSDGQQWVFSEQAAGLAQAEDLGRRVAEELIAQGAMAWLK